jgi:polyphosphate kinase 2 (PPK2 family)
VCIIFEGRDGAGKGGAIKAIIERVGPRGFRVVALTAPTDRRPRCTCSASSRTCRAGEVAVFDTTTPASSA